MEGDYFNTSKVAETICGADAVLSTIGPPLSRKHIQRVGGKYPEAMQSLIREMSTAKIAKIVAIAGAGCFLENEKTAFSRKMIRRILRVLVGQLYLDKEKEHQLLAASSLDWTIVRPPQIKAEKEGQLVASHKKLASGAVDVGQLVHFMLNNLENDDWLRAAPLVATVKK